jgi:hypothetical protein
MSLQTIGISIPAAGWSNKGEAADRVCRCGTWKNHWINFVRESWPATCSVLGCSGTPTLGGHVINKRVSGEWIVPMCDSCNQRVDTFKLKIFITVPSAIESKTCGLEIKGITCR